jgi:hypothetical protein
MRIKPVYKIDEWIRGKWVAAGREGNLRRGEDPDLIFSHTSSAPAPLRSIPKNQRTPHY